VDSGFNRFLLQAVEAENTHAAQIPYTVPVPRASGHIHKTNKIQQGSL
jgi:hypothetical protein